MHRAAVNLRRGAGDTGMAHPAVFYGPGNLPVMASTTELTVDDFGHGDLVTTCLELKAQIGMLVGQINNQPEDVHELYELLHQKLNEFRATGQPLPGDLVELERQMLSEFPQTSKA